VAAFVIDASVAASWCFPDERTAETDAVLEALSNSAEAIAPRLWAYEIRNSVLIGIRRKRITSAHAEEFFQDLQSFRIRLVDPPSYKDLFTLATRHDLTIYDAAYLDTALRESLPLASLDKNLIRATERTGLKLFQH